MTEKYKSTKVALGCLMALTGLATVGCLGSTAIFIGGAFSHPEQQAQWFTGAAMAAGGAAVFGLATWGLNASIDGIDRAGNRYYNSPPPQSSEPPPPGGSGWW